jgi:hypothetical protein
LFSNRIGIKTTDYRKEVKALLKQTKNEKNEKKNIKLIYVFCHSKKKNACLQLFARLMKTWKIINLGGRLFKNKKNNIDCQNGPQRD